MVGRIKKGFTLVELSLALALIGVLSIIVILLISNAVSAYHRGLTLNQINTVGMALVDDMRAAIQASPGRFDYESECRAVYGDVSVNHGKRCVDDKGKKFVMIKRYASVNMAADAAPIFGAFCTGKYSYIWNSGYLFNDEDYSVSLSGGAAELNFKNSRGEYEKKSGFKILKIEDENRAICKLAAGAAGDPMNRGNIEPKYLDDSKIRGVIEGESVFNFENKCEGKDNPTMEVCEGLNADTVEENLMGENSGYGGVALYDLTVMPPASSEGTNNLFYTASFVLGTVQGGINVMAQGDYCAAPEDVDMASVENFDYCAINKFNFAAQATGG